MPYWGFRIDVNCQDYPDYYVKELNERGVLRQGWGYDEGQNLLNLDQNAPPREQQANVRMFNAVKKGDYVLIPRIPEWEFVTIARATEDWDKGYVFGIDEDRKDYGHQFPAEKITHFHRQNQHVHGNVRSTLRCRSRFWDMSYYAESLEELVERLPKELTTDQDWEDRFKGPVSAVMKSLNERIEARVHKALLEQFEGSEWEYALAIGLKALFPHYGVERTGGAVEQKHGTDILITMPGPLPNVQYGIAMQVKDWRDTAFNVSGAVDQVKKADEGWKDLRPGLRIIDKIVVVTGAAIPDDEQRERDGVTILAPRDLQELLRRMAVATAAARDE